MHEEVNKMLERGPHPLKWGAAILLLVFITTLWQSVIVGVLTGILIGAYFGNYRGRSAIMDAWMRNIHLDHERDMAALEAEYKQRRAS